jgi:hypothetical protein
MPEIKFAHPSIYHIVAIAIISLLATHAPRVHAAGEIPPGANPEPLYFNVKSAPYNAKGDGKVVLDGATTAGSDRLASASAHFAASDVGKKGVAPGAGAAASTLFFTIKSVADPTTAVMDVSASTTTTGNSIFYGTDDQKSIQAAIQAAFDAGGGTVFFPKGIYNIAGPYVTSVDSVNPNCQLYLPLSTDRSSARTIVLKGEVPPFFPEAGQVHPAADPPIDGVVLYSTTGPGKGTPAIIGSSFANNGFSNSNWTTGVFLNLCIRAYAGTKKYPVPGNRYAINATNLSKVYGDNLMIDHSCPPEASVAPLETIGIASPGIFNFAESWWGRVFIVGYSIGMTLGEHTSVDYLTISGARKGVVPLYGAAGCHINFYTPECFSYGVYCPSGSPGNNLTITKYMPEHDALSWAPYVADVYVDPGLNRSVFITHAQIGGNPSIFKCNDNDKCKLQYLDNIDIDSAVQVIADAASVVIDLYKGKMATWTLGGNRTITAFSNMGAGDHLTLFVTQDATGKRTLKFPENSRVSGSLASAPNAVSRIAVEYDGTHYYFTITNPV